MSQKSLLRIAKFNSIFLWMSSFMTWRIHSISITIDTRLNEGRKTDQIRLKSSSQFIDKHNSDSIQSNVRRHRQHNIQREKKDRERGKKCQPSLYSAIVKVRFAVDWWRFVVTVVVARILRPFVRSSTRETEREKWESMDRSNTLFDCFFIFCWISDLTVCNNSFSNHSYRASSGLRFS